MVRYSGGVTAQHLSPPPNLHDNQEKLCNNVSCPEDSTLVFLEGVLTSREHTGCQLILSVPHFVNDH